MPTVRFQSTIPARVDDVFDWHTRPGAFERLSPPWEKLTVVRRRGTIRDGDLLEFVIDKWPRRIKWQARHRDYVAGQQFADEQTAGPFARWYHVHRFTAGGPNTCRVDDQIDYKLPLGRLGQYLAGPFAHRMVSRMFAQRHDQLTRDMERHQKFAAAGPQRIIVGGASGLVGQALRAFLTSGGHDVRALVRGPADPASNDITWSPRDGTLEASRLEGTDAVIHLGGAGIADGRWTDERKRVIRDSRVRSTRLLCETVAGLQRPPRVFICASAVGYYGDTGHRAVDESGPAGQGFLADVCRDWEAATTPAVEAGLRVVNLRIGMVLAAAGGALAKMLTPFKLGMGGRVGDGRQYISWISRDDLVGAIHHAIFTDSLKGPVNAVSPEPVTNADFVRTLGTILHRPSAVPLPALAVKLMLGEMGEALLLTSTRVTPNQLTQAGFAFRDPDLDTALRHELGKTVPD